MIHLLLDDVFKQHEFAAAFGFNKAKAVDALERPGADFRVLVTDINLGRDQRSGRDVARRARRLIPALAVVCLTGDCAAE